MKETGFSESSRAIHITVSKLVGPKYDFSLSCIRQILCKFHARISMFIIRSMFVVIIVNYRNITVNTFSGPGHTLVPTDLESPHWSVGAALQGYLRLEVASEFVGVTAATACPISSFCTEQLHPTGRSQER